MAIIRKWQILGEKGKFDFGKKMESSRPRPNTSEMTKRGIRMIKEGCR